MHKLRSNTCCYCLVPSDKNAIHHVRYDKSDDVLAAELPLHLVKFAKTSQLSLFVVDNLGDDDTSVIVSIDACSAEKTVKKVEFVQDVNFADKVAAAGDKTVFVDFTAGW